MCQSHGHSDSTLDLIINRTVLLTAQLPDRCKKEKTDTGKKKSVPVIGSDANPRVSVCTWKWMHTTVRLDGADDCAWCGGISTPAPPSVPLYPLWPARLLQHNKCRTGTLTNTPRSLVLWKKEAEALCFYGRSQKLKQSKEIIEHFEKQANAYLFSCQELDERIDTSLSCVQENSHIHQLSMLEPQSRINSLLVYWWFCAWLLLF